MSAMRVFSKRWWQCIIVVLLVSLNTTVGNAQTYFEPSARDVAMPTELQKTVGKTTYVGMVGLPLVALTTVLVKQDWKGLTQGLEVAGATIGTTFLLKFMVNERRPDGSNMHSFPSGHTSFTFAAAGFLQRRYGWAFGIPAYAVSAYVGWGRVYAKKHHIWDTVVGAAIGMAFAYVFTTPFAEKHDLSLQTFSNGGIMGVQASMNF